MSFKPTLSLSSFTFIKGLLSSSSLSAIRVVSSDVKYCMFNSVLCVTILQCPHHWEKTLLGVVIIVPFLYKEDILYAPEQQFVSDKLHMKHLLAKYIWEVFSGSYVGSIFCLAVSLGVLNWENVSFTEAWWLSIAQVPREKYEETNNFSTCVCLILAKAITWYVFVRKNRSIGWAKRMEICLISNFKNVQQALNN